MRHSRGVLRFLAVGALGLLSLPPGIMAQARTDERVGRDVVQGLQFQPLRFDPPRVQERTLDSGLAVFLMEDHSLPLVTLYARFKGGYALLPRESYAPAFALSGLVRSGGTTELSPDSVDHLVDFYALNLSFGGGGQSTFGSVNTLAKHLEPAVDLWSDILRHPRFDPDEVEIWRARQLESIRRRGDSPGFLAVSEFNRIMFGDHPIGWDMEETDLTPVRLNTQTLSRVHSRIICPENLILGVVGAVTWDEVKPLLEEMVSGWPACSEPLLEPRIPELREERRVFLIPKDLTQSHIVVAGPGGVTQSADPDYFASRIGNSILGAGGFSSRLLSRVRTDEGFAYGVSSFWTTPSRSSGIVGATTQTKSESTIEVTRLLLEIIAEMGEDPPAQDEVDRVVSQTVNSFVFNFQDPAQVVSRQMFYLAQDLPTDWLVRYVQGIQGVSPGDIQDAFRRHVRPQDMTILIVGDPESFDLPPDVLGEVEIWEVRGGGGVTEPPRGVRRSPR
jgi:zinc protease